MNSSSRRRWTSSKLTESESYSWNRAVPVRYSKTNIIASVHDLAFAMEVVKSEEHLLDDALLEKEGLGGRT